MSRSRLVCCRNATSAAMSAIKISTEKMCFLVAENTSVFESAENTSVFESVGQSSWAAAQSRVCSLFPPSSQHTVEKSPQNAIIVIWNLLWNKALEEARVKLHPPGEKCFSLSDLLLSSKQTGEARKQWKTQKLKEANSNRHHLFDPWSLMVSSVTVYPAMFFHFILILLFV